VNRAIVTYQSDSADLAWEELKADSTRVVQELSEETALIELPEPFDDFVYEWSPIFIRHISPVQTTLPVESADAIPALAEHIGAVYAPQIAPTSSYSVQTRILAANAPFKPFDVNNAASDALKESGAPLDVRAPEQILSIVIAANELLTAHIGLSLAVQNLSNWAGGVHRFARDDQQISRAEFKLLEALDVFGITLPDRGAALDLGAAPGGWTRVLRRRGLIVTAVDPAALDDRLIMDKNIRHKRMTAETYLTGNTGRFDVIVNDMRMDADDSARLMVQAAKLLNQDGVGIMTVKLPNSRRRADVDKALNILRGKYTLIGARQLFHNRSELTAGVRL
jgi:23S rRNA (cytidine2498-2'-O)-methyltransferase